MPKNTVTVTLTREEVWDAHTACTGAANDWRALSVPIPETLAWAQERAASLESAAHKLEEAADAPKVAQNT